MLVIIALPEKDGYIIDLEGDLDAYSDPELVSNSDIGFFYKNEQLAEYRQQKKPDKANVIQMSENIVTTDFTKNSATLVPDVKTTYTGSTKLIMSNGQMLEYVAESADRYHLKGGETVSKEDSFRITLSTGVWGSNPVLPHKIEKLNKYYTAFTQKVQSIYFVFTTNNEFASIQVSELKTSVSYELLDSEMKKLKNGTSAAASSVNIEWKGRSAGTYYLKLTGSFSGELSPFCVQLPTDDNEWMWQMQYVNIDTLKNGKFEYYGDEDFYVLPPEVTENMNKSVINFTKIPADTNVVIYDKDKNILAQYLQKKDNRAPVSLYALKGAYAVSFYSFDGAASGSEYEFRFGYIDSVILDIQTYGFALSPGYSDKEDYYLASVSSLEGKMITEIMTAVDTTKPKVTVAQQCGYEYTAKVGEPLELAPGRNTVKISFQVGDRQREITIVISHRANEVYYSYTSKGEKIFVVDDNPENNLIQIQKPDGSYNKIKRIDLFTYKETQMPDSYKEKIEALQAKHPNWKFTFVKTGYSFSDYVTTQDRVEGSTPVSALDGKRATREQIEYYVDPRNFLDEQSIFMFEKQTYTDGIYSPKGIESIWVEKPEAVLSESAFVSYFAQAGESTGLSPYFITARAALESGHGTSKLALGQITGCEGYYNFYGIDATDANPSGGGKFAKDHNWSTRRRAIIEGAAWIKNQYIGCMQYNAYFMKYSFIPTRTWHQYMTDIAAPVKDAQSYYKAHANGGTLNTEIEFVIPVFDNMPA